MITKTQAQSMISLCCHPPCASREVPTGEVAVMTCKVMLVFFIMLCSEIFPWFLIHQVIIFRYWVIIKRQWTNQNWTWATTNSPCICLFINCSFRVKVFINSTVFRVIFNRLVIAIDFIIIPVLEESQIFKLESKMTNRITVSSSFTFLAVSQVLLTP